MSSRQGMLQGMCPGRAWLIGLCGLLACGVMQAQQSSSGFNALDRNHDGSLSPNELGAGVSRELGAQIINGDGVITKDEFLTIPRRRVQESLSNMDKNAYGALSQGRINQNAGIGFQQMDSNRDGKVSQAEWRRAKQNMGRRALGRALLNASEKLQEGP